MRAMVLIVSVVCVATVVSELAGLGMLWYRGQLSPQTVAEIRLALSGDDHDTMDTSEETKQEQPSSGDFAAERVTRILKLSTREEELDLLKRVVSDNRKGLTDEQGKFQKQKMEFETQLEQLRTSTAAAATEQSRGILQALQPADAIANLMALPAEENVLLLQGMPEKSIARILQTFLAGTDEQRVRGQEIFKALSQGDPSRMLIDNTLTNLTGSTPTAN